MNKTIVVIGLYIIILTVLIIGCTKEECPITECDVCEECEICTECSDCIECNVTECEECEKGNYDKSYVMGLIREAKKCERSLYYYNLSDCHYELNRTNQQLDRCEDETDIDNVTIELRECEDRLCDTNSSWC